LARLGGGSHPKGYQQFEAIAYNRGADNKPNTPDDVNLGVVDVEWSVEEFYAVFGDDDKDFVGTLSPAGLFTPNIEGPNPKRKFNRNNYGDVWVVATLKSETDKDGRPMSGRAHLVVTIPLYVRWDQPEVAE
jgi:quinohemoprotein amine dehydrogenase